MQIMMFHFSVILLSSWCIMIQMQSWVLVWVFSVVGIESQDLFNVGKLSIHKTYPQPLF